MFFRVVKHEGMLTRVTSDEAEFVKTPAGRWSVQGHGMTCSRDVTWGGQLYRVAEEAVPARPFPSPVMCKRLYVLAFSSTRKQWPDDSWAMSHLCFSGGITSLCATASTVCCPDTVELDALTHSQAVGGTTAALVDTAARWQPAGVFVKHLDAALAAFDVFSVDMHWHAALQALRLALVYGDASAALLAAQVLEQLARHEGEATLDALLAAPGGLSSQWHVNLLAFFLHTAQWRPDCTPEHADACRQALRLPAFVACYKKSRRVL